MFNLNKEMLLFANFKKYLFNEEGPNVQYISFLFVTYFITLHYSMFDEHIELKDN